MAYTPRSNPASAKTNFGAVQDAGVLILDGDGLCYEAAAASNTLNAAVQKLKQKVLEFMFLLGVEECRMHLTAAGGKKNHRGRLRGVLPYQGNRLGKAKPPLLELLRTVAAKEGTFEESLGIRVILHRFYEADDGMMQDAYTLPKCIVYSADKDLRIVPCPWYNKETGTMDIIKDRFGWASFDEDSGKVLGHGTKFFWAQLLMGDSADNVKGLCSLAGKRCGASTAGELLRGVQDESVLANLVIGLYRCINQNPWPEAYALWLLRTEDDHVMKYITSLQINAENQAFLQRMWQEPWMAQDERPETEESE